MENLPEMMRRIRQDLTKVQQTLNWAAVQRQENGLQAPAGVTFDDIVAFKSSIDDMRHFLWAYMEGVSKGDYVVKTFRMQRATEMLRSLRNEMEEAPMPEVPETRTFFEALNSIAGEILEKHRKDN